MTVTDSEGVSSTTSEFNLTVVSVNDIPTISGTLITSVNEDSLYEFIPVVNDNDAN